MTTTTSEPTKLDQTFAGTNHVAVGEPAPPLQGAADADALRWWRADPDDWMHRAAWRPRLAVPGVVNDMG